MRALILAFILASLAAHAADAHRFSTLFTAHDVKNHLSTPEGRAKARQWCRDASVSKVYIETFRDGYQASADALKTARDEFAAAGFEVSGCVTPTQVGKKSTGWNIIACYTDSTNQARIKTLFEFTARIFDETMIDDFWFTDCACSECDAARLANTVTIGGKIFPVAADSWEAYRCELLLRLSEENVLGAARAANPRSTLIIKYPQWYDRFHERGYDVDRETALFDRIWVGTETRDYTDAKWGGTPQYEAYFIMRWLGGIGGAKCGGGWYDWLGTTEATYIEQARQTILAGARESLLFCYSGLQGTTGPANIAALRKHIPELQKVAAEVQRRQPVGVAAYKPANSHAGKEPRIFDFVGMLGFPLAPTHEFPTNARAAFFSVHALKDSAFREKFAAFLDRGGTALITDGLASQLGEVPKGRLRILAAKNDPKSIMNICGEDLKELRAPVLKALGLEFDAPASVGFYPFTDGSWVVENFGDSPVKVQVAGDAIEIAARGWEMSWK